jgi:hypothetical protein
MEVGTLQSGGGRWSVSRNASTPEAELPPDYARTFAALRNEELLEEIELGRGGEAYQAAAVEEARRRGLA